MILCAIIQNQKELRLILRWGMGMIHFFWHSRILQRLLHSIFKKKVSCVPAFDVGIFNFGYLPQTDKCVTTKLATSKIAVEKALACLAVHGVLILVLYPGHAEGKKEADYFLEKAKALPSKQFAICHIALMNKKQAPSILVIERQAKG